MMLVVSLALTPAYIIRLSASYKGLKTKDIQSMTHLIFIHKIIQKIALNVFIDGKQLVVNT